MDNTITLNNLKKIFRGRYQFVPCKRDSSEEWSWVIKDQTGRTIGHIYKYVAELMGGWYGRAIVDVDGTEIKQPEWSHYGKGWGERSKQKGIRGMNAMLEKVYYPQLRTVLEQRK